MLNAQWLETFTVLCETGHFTRTAELLGMTQPGVSQHLRKLEQQVGQPLISRRGKSFTPTPAGEAVFALGKSRRAEEAALREAIQQDDPAQGKVGIACSGSFAMLLYPQLFPVMQTAPGLTLRLEAAPRGGVLAGVLDGRFDLGIVDHEPAHARLEAQYLAQEDLCLLWPADGPAPPVSLGDLDALGFVSHPDGPGYAEELFALNFPAEFQGADRLHVRTFVNQISQIPAPVAQGIGYTLLPRSGVAAFPDAGRLRIVDLPKGCRHDLWIIFRRGRVLPARIRRMMELIQSIASGLEAHR